MKIDIGLLIVVLAVLFFYLRLIILQRERVKRIRQEAEIRTKGSGKSRKRPATDQSSTAEMRVGIVSQKRSDWVVAGLGIIAIILGVLLYADVLPLEAAQPYWWIPLSAGIVAFSWGFRY